MKAFPQQKMKNPACVSEMQPCVACFRLPPITRSHSLARIDVRDTGRYEPPSDGSFPSFRTGTMHANAQSLGHSPFW